MKLIDICADKDANSFNLVRMLAAMAVLVSHGYVIATGEKGDEPLRSYLGTSLGGLAVIVFFVISGFLITGSMFSSGNWRRFLITRASRIYPALLVCNLLVWVTCGLFFTSSEVSSYFSDADGLKFMFSNSTLFLDARYHLLGVFLDNPLPQTVNGSLWTLPWELRAYILTLLFWYVVVILKVADQAAWLMLGAVAISYLVSTFFLGGFYAKVVELIYAFSYGAFLQLYKKNIRIQTLVWMMVPCLMVFVVSDPVIRKALLMLALPPVTLVICLMRLPFLFRYNRIDDISYGVYLYAFPLQQMVCALVGDWPVLQQIFLSVILVIPLAILSWRFVERPFIRMSERINRQLVNKNG
jgi:peptidoglycan/LPS O-acetylase OafA/YrhL